MTLRKAEGFILIRLLVVIAIVAILAAILFLSPRQSERAGTSGHSTGPGTTESTSHTGRGRGLCVGCR